MQSQINSIVKRMEKNAKKYGDEKAAELALRELQYYGITLQQFEDYKRNINQRG